MNNNWDALIKAIVPLSFMAIWAITSLFNRDTKSRPTINPPPRTGPNPPPRPRTTDPTLRWANPNASGSAGLGQARPVQRPLSRAGADEIVILSSSSSITEPRSTPARNQPRSRPAKGRPAVPARRVEPTPSRTTRLAGVTQNVSQHLADTGIEMTPLAGIAQQGEAISLGLSSTPSLVSQGAVATSSELPRTAAALILADPARLREVFIFNEIIQPPLALRGRGRRRMI